jgi:DNA uptake protein ComE-like DNA-binding protein
VFDEKTLVSDKKFLDWQLILFVILGLVGLVAVSGGLYFLMNTTNQACITEEIAPDASKSAVLTSARNQIYVDLAGAVKQPGLYELSANHRLAAAIDLAGGFADNANQEFISQELNLAQRLKDGDKIYISSQEELEYAQEVAEFCNQQAESNQSDFMTQVSINQASQEELQTLDGIGEKRAEDIVAGRPYQQLADLVEKEVLTPTIYKNIENLLKL